MFEFAGCLPRRILSIFQETGRITGNGLLGSISSTRGGLFSSGTNHQFIRRCAMSGFRIFEVQAIGTCIVSERRKNCSSRMFAIHFLRNLGQTCIPSNMNHEPVYMNRRYAGPFVVSVQYSSGCFSPGCNAYILNCKG